MAKATSIQLSDNRNDYTIDILYDDGLVEADSTYGKHERAKAERRAEVLANLCGCSWETNY